LPENYFWEAMAIDASFDGGLIKFGTVVLGSRVWGCGAERGLSETRARQSVVGQDDKNTVIKAIVSAVERNDAQVEQVTSRLSLERDVVGISWQALPVGVTE
jgi:hypothetical protein